MKPLKFTSNINRKSICLISLHSDEILKELPFVNSKGNEIGIVIINRCTNCGRIKDTKVRTVDHI